ncbi:MAG TPA: hypothetical protein VFT56_04090 [Sphingomonas sp.]|nr:hypothetical protein [Sphingomonas sp.]
MSRKVDSAIAGTCCAIVFASIVYVVGFGGGVAVARQVDRSVACPAGALAGGVAYYPIRIAA